jgi:hypothetical protein
VQNIGEARICRNKNAAIKVKGMTFIAAPAYY